MGKAEKNRRMKELVAAILLVVVFASFSTLQAQARVGYKSTDIMAEFRDKGIKMDVANDGTRYLWYADNVVTVAYYLDNNYVCESTVIIPVNQGTLNYYCEKFNKEAVIISDTKWKLYTANGIMYINLIYDKEGGYYFRLY